MRAASSVIRPITLPRVRASSGISIASELQQVGDRNLLDVGHFGRPIERAFHVHERLVIGEADAIFEPMVDFRGGEPPLAADAPAGQLAAFGQLLTAAGIMCR